MCDAIYECPKSGHELIHSDDSNLIETRYIWCQLAYQEIVILVKFIFAAIVLVCNGHVLKDTLPILDSLNCFCHKNLIMCEMHDQKRCFLETWILSQPCQMNPNQYARKKIF